jgi:hypothetical protein
VALLQGEPERELIGVNCAAINGVPLFKLKENYCLYTHLLQWEKKIYRSISAGARVAVEATAIEKCDRSENWRNQ